MNMIAVDGAPITVNGIAITSAQIDGECSAHPVGHSKDVRRAAIVALVRQELLLQEAVKRGLCDRDGAINQPDKTIERLLALEISTSLPDEASCESYFSSNKGNFSTAPLYEASHIFFAAPPGEQAAREEVRKKALCALERIKENPACFDEVARQESACSSAVKGGDLGALAKGQTVPAFEAALMAMKEGDISDRPVETEVGFHIIKVDERIEGEDLPFEMVKHWISQYLSERQRSKAVENYVKKLAGLAQIEGFDARILHC